MPEAISLVWKDRKRILGMPVTFTKYALSEDRLFLETGLFNIKYEEILLYRVRDISMTVTLGQRILGVGSIVVKSSDKSVPLLTLENIKRPKEVKELVHKHVEEMKIQRRMRVGEIITDDCEHDDLMDGTGDAPE